MSNRSNPITISIDRLITGSVALIFCVLASGSVFAQPEKVAKTFADITKKVEPAVVSVDTKGKTPQPVAREATTPNDGSDVMEFLRKQMQQRPVHGVGSGFIVDKTGYIVTNFHVVDDAARITVKLDSGEEYEAKVIGTDDETDLAVLKIQAPHDLPFVKFGDSDKAEVGDWVLAIGSPFGLTKTVTAGIISQTRRETPYASGIIKIIQNVVASAREPKGFPALCLAGRPRALVSSTDTG